MRTMSPHLRGLIACIAGTLLLLTLSAPVASAAGAGGVEAKPGSVSEPAAGGAEYGSASLRPTVRVRALRLMRARVRRGTAPRLSVRIVRPGASRVRVVATIRGRRVVRRASFARVPVGRVARLTLPRGLRVGRHRVRLRVYGLEGDRPVRSSAVTLTVVPKPKPKPRPKRKSRPRAEKPRSPSSTPVPPSSPTVPVVPPSLGGPGTVAGVFPVRGAYSLGNAGSRFGAGRDDHSHEGQDILAASGSPVVAPLAGTVLFNSYQANGAGRYVILRADNGWDMMFAHCLAGSATLDAGARVAAGGQLCAVGATGSASGPHLHFEIWPDGWRHMKGTRPVDPLPHLRAWAGA